MSFRAYFYVAPSESEGSLGTCVPREDKKESVPREDIKESVPREDKKGSVLREDTVGAVAQSPLFCHPEANFLCRPEA